MSAPRAMFVFIPHTIFNKLLYDCYVLGFRHVSENNILVNCSTLIERKNKDFDSTISRLLNYNVDELDTIRFLGIIYSSEQEKQIETDCFHGYSHDLTFIMRINETFRSFHVEHISVAQYANSFDVLDVQVIIYDACSLTNSQLLSLNKNVSFDKTSRKTFVTFLVGTCQNFVTDSNNMFCYEQLKNLSVSNFTRLNDQKLYQMSSHFHFAVLWLLSFFHRFTICAFSWSVFVVLMLT